MLDDVVAPTAVLLIVVVATAYLVGTSIAQNHVVAPQGVDMVSELGANERSSRLFRCRRSFWPGPPRWQRPAPQPSEQALVVPFSSLCFPLPVAETYLFLSHRCTLLVAGLNYVCRPEPTATCLLLLQWLCLWGLTVDVTTALVGAIIQLQRRLARLRQLLRA
jgi:hypothetical protein